MMNRGEDTSSSNLLHSTKGKNPNSSSLSSLEENRTLILPVNPLNNELSRIRQLKDEEAAAGVDSSSSSGDQVTRQRESLNASDRDSSTANGSGTSGNVVTATTTTSSGDDRDSPGGNAGGDTISGGATSEQSGPGSELIRHHHHRSRRRTYANDGSTLQVPGDDGSYRLLGGPATVVASRLRPPNSDTTTNVSSSGSGGEGEMIQETLLQPHREPGYHTIRRTFSKLPRRADSRRGVTKNSATDSSSMEDGVVKKKAPKPSSNDPSPNTKQKKKKKKKASPRAADKSSPNARAKSSHTARGRGSQSPDSVNSSTADGAEGGGSSSGSGTEGGYAGSASSNEASGQQESSSSSPSVSSSEESRPKSKSKRHRKLKDDAQRKKSSKQTGVGGSGDSSSSSEIADFSSGASILNGEDARGFTIKTFTASPSASPSLSSSNEDSLDGLEETYLRAKQSVVQDQARMLEAATRKRKAVVEGSKTWSRHRHGTKWPRPTIRLKAQSKGKKEDRPPILTLGSDIMAHVLTFLHPPEILDVLTMPLSRDWRQTFTSQPELWRVLCLVEPFKAKMEENEDSDSSESFCSLQGEASSFDKRLLDRYRLLYTSFVRCMKYLSQIREDAINGRPPSFIDYGIAGGNSSGVGGAPMLVGTNRSLQSFLARARGVVADSKESSSESNEISENEEEGIEAQPVQNTLTAVPLGKVRQTLSFSPHF